MISKERQHVVNELQQFINGTQATLNRFEGSGMDEELAKDYEELLAILDNAVKHQREHTRVMLG